MNHVLIIMTNKISRGSHNSGDTLAKQPHAPGARIYVSCRNDCIVSSVEASNFSRWRFNSWCALYAPAHAPKHLYFLYDDLSRSKRTSRETITKKESISLPDLLNRNDQRVENTKCAQHALHSRTHSCELRSRLRRGCRTPV